jgi:hypothetical protein
MQRTRSESLLNALVMSVALLVSYAAPRLVGAPASLYASAAPARSVDLGAIGRVLGSGGDDDDDARPNAGEADDEGAEEEASFEGKGARRLRGRHGGGRGVRVYVR